MYFNLLYLQVLKILVNISSSLLLKYLPLKREYLFKYLENNAGTYKIIILK